MNILITLPKFLLEYIISGEKEYEMRKCLPKDMEIGVDGFFVVEKGTDVIRCWCRVDGVRENYIDHYSAERLAPRLCVPVEYIERYANNKKVYLWKIGETIELQGLKRDTLCADRNPQQFAYCPFSFGRSFLNTKLLHETF